MALLSFRWSFFLVILCITFNSPVKAQPIDSLTNLLSKHKKQDETRVDLLYKLAGFEYTLNGNSDTALYYLDEVERLSLNLSFSEGQAKSNYLKGIIFRSRGRFDEAEAYLLSALKFHKSVEDAESISHCHHHLAILKQAQGEHKEAIRYFEEFIRYMGSVGDTTAIAHALSNTGNSYADIGEFEQALSTYNEALNMYLRLNDEEGQASCYNKIGTIYMSQSNNPKAFDFFNKSLYLRQKIGDSIGAVYSMNNMGIIYKRQENFDKAIETYTDALKLLSIEKHQQEIAQLKSNLGMAYAHKKDFVKALNLVKESLEINQKLNRLNQVAVSLNNIGDIHMRTEQFSEAREYYQRAGQIGLQLSAKYRLINSYMGVSRSYLKEFNYDSTLIYALKCKTIADELDLLAHKNDVEEILWQVYSSTGDYKKAFESHQRFKLLSDSLFNKENIKKITQLEYEYKYKQELESAEKRELKLNEKVESTTKDLEKSQQNSLIAVIIILFISLISVIIIFVLKLRHVEAKNQNILIEQKLLRSQMTPHFMFNSLSVLQGMILSKEEDKSVQYLSEFSKLLRTVLENSRHKSVSLSKELKAIESYMTLKNLDAKPPYDYSMSVGSNINGDEINIPPMLIQPFIENAIEHAFPHQKNNREIKVDIRLEKGQLICTIEDNGIGINHSISDKKKGSLATVITSERLDMLSKDFTGKGSVDIKNKKMFGGKGTLVTLIIPYKTGYAA